MKRPFIEQSENEILKPEVEETDSLLTTSEVSNLLKIHVSTVRRWSSLGIFESCGRGPRGERLFQKKDVIESMLIFKPNSLPNGLL
jgi:hypothetical protein